MTIDPWVNRDSYGKNGPCPGLSILVLGESSYTKGKHGIRGAPLPPDWNQQIIGSFLEKGDDLTIKRATDVFYATPLTDRGQERKFWQSTAFANFIQMDMGEPGKRPRKREWLVGQQAFQQYLLELRLQFVLAVGFGLWDNLPDKCRQEHHFSVKPPRGPTGVERPCLLYPNGNGSALVCGIRHTSRGFSHEVWSRWVMASIAEAARLHQIVCRGGR